MSIQMLITTAKAMVAEGKGLLAMDESTPPVTNVLKKWGFLKLKKHAVPIGN